MVYTEAFIQRLLDTAGFKGCFGFKPIDDKTATFYWGDFPLATVRAGEKEPEYYIKNDDIVDQMEKLLKETAAMEVV